LSAEIKSRLQADHKFADLAYYFGFPLETVLAHTTPEDYDCLKKSVATFE